LTMTRSRPRAFLGREDDHGTRRRAAVLLLCVAVFGAILALSLGPDLLSGRSHLVEESAHAVAYAALTLVILIAWSLWERRFAVPVAILLSAGVILVGIGVEVAQYLLGRDAEWADVRANALGAGVAFGLWLVGWTITRVVRRGGSR
jgi:VanZ family protein